jgi:uncharacterized membrane protein
MVDPVRYFRRRYAGPFFAGDAFAKEPKTRLRSPVLCWGILIIANLSLFPKQTGGLHAFLIPVFGTAAILIAGVMAAALFKNKK